MILFLKAAWEWVKKYWKWLLFPLGIVLYVLGRLTASRSGPTVVTTSELSGAAKTQQDATEKEKSVQEAAEKAKDEKLQQIDAKHADVVAQLNEEQQAKAQELRQDPDKLNEYLLDVGKQLRQP